MSRIKFQIVLYSRADGSQYYVNEYLKPTMSFDKALKTSNLNTVAEIIDKYLYAFRIAVITLKGEVIKKYN